MDAYQWEACVKAPPLFGREFRHEDHGAALFRATRKALKQAQQNEQNRSPNAQDRIGR